jgi:tetrahydromethanopterin S-methyltransferase subunit G
MAEITKKDILEVLKEFSKKTLDPKFSKIDQRFDQMDRRLEHHDTRFEQIDQRMDGLDKKVDQFKDEIIHRFHVISEDVISQVKLVAEGVINLDEKFTREIGIFRKENEQAHEEIKAMIKFSYAELDRRISILETEVQELKRRMDQIERRSIS